MLRYNRLMTRDMAALALSWLLLRHMEPPPAPCAESDEHSFFLMEQEEEKGESGLVEARNLAKEAIDELQRALNAHACETKTLG